MVWIFSWLVLPVMFSSGGFLSRICSNGGLWVPPKSIGNPLLEFNALIDPQEKVKDQFIIEKFLWIRGRLRYYGSDGCGIGICGTAILIFFTWFPRILRFLKRVQLIEREPRILNGILNDDLA